MFGNFLYFIIVLLIYTTYQPSGSPHLTSFEAFSAFLGSTLLYGFLVHRGFSRIPISAAPRQIPSLDRIFHRRLHRFGVMAVALFAADLYLLGLPDHLGGFCLTDRLTTLLALVFIGLFIGYMILLYHAAWPVYRRLYNSRMSRTAYIRSQILAAVPVLLPWLVLSGLEDLIFLLPFSGPKELISTTAGQLVFFLLFLMAVAVLGPALIHRFWECRPLPGGPLRRRIESVCQRAGMKYRDILLWPIFEGRMITAGVMGLTGWFRYILVTEALISSLRDKELEAVIAHEIGHVKQYHLIFYLLFFVGYMLFSLAALDLIFYTALYTAPVYHFLFESGTARLSAAPIGIACLHIVFFLIYFRYIFGYFMRNFERQADIYVYRLLDSALPLIATFEKIVIATGQDPDRPNWHHFSIAERIRYLMNCEKNPEWVTRHHRKVKQSVAAFLLVMFLMMIGGWIVNFGETGKAVSDTVSEQVLIWESAAHPERAKPHRLLGDLYLSRKEYPKAVKEYERALDLAPDEPEILNNLAWILATAEAPEARRPRRALRLALRAASLDSSPYIQDTLAEAYFLNECYAQAVKTEKKAIETASPADRPFYERRLKKFLPFLEGAPEDAIPCPHPNGLNPGEAGPGETTP